MVGFLEVSMRQFLNFALTALLMLNVSACTSIGNVLNPFYDEPPPEALLGEKNDHAISGERKKSLDARTALEAMATYKRAHLPEPVNPVIQPAVVRLMWVPDHLNRNGDLVPAHYYYLKVLKDRWAVTDAFELEEQLGTRPGSSNLPYVHQGEAVTN